MSKTLSWDISQISLTYPNLAVFIPCLSFQLSRYLQPKKLNLGYPRTRYDIFCNLKKTKVIHEISHIPAPFGLTGQQQPSGPCGSLAPGWHGGHTQPRPASQLFRVDAPLSHRQTPQTRLARPKLPQPLDQLVDVAPFLLDTLEASAQQQGNFLPFR